jgi:hypothetical protein
VEGGGEDELPMPEPHLDSSDADDRRWFPGMTLDEQGERVTCDEQGSLSTHSPAESVDQTKWCVCVCLCLCVFVFLCVCVCVCVCV